MDEHSLTDACLARQQRERPLRENQISQFPLLARSLLRLSLRCSPQSPLSLLILAACDDRIPRTAIMGAGARHGARPATDHGCSFTKVGHVGDMFGDNSCMGCISNLLGIQKKADDSPDLPSKPWSLVFKFIGAGAVAFPRGGGRGELVLDTLNALVIDSNWKECL